MLTNSNIRGMGYRPLSNGGALLGVGTTYYRVPANGPGFFGALAFNNSAMAWPSYGKLSLQTAVLAPFLEGTVRGTAVGLATPEGGIMGEGDVATEITGLATTDALGELGALIAAEAYGLATVDSDIMADGDIATELLIGGPLTGESVSGELLATRVEGSVTVGAALRIILATLAGKLSGAPTGPIVIRDVNDTKDRVTASVDANGNRTGVTVDGD